MKYIEKRSLVGMDWHDSRDYTTYIGKKSDPDDLDITGLNPTLLIADDILKEMEGFGYTVTDCTDTILEKYGIEEGNIPSFQNLVEILQNKKNWKYEDEHGLFFSIVFDGNSFVRVLTDISGYGSDINYRVMRTPDNEVRYLALEEIYAPYKGAYTIQRIYDEPFLSMAEAKEAIKKIPSKREGYSTARVVQIASLAQIESDHFKKWFSNNQKMKKAEQEEPGRFLLTARGL